MMKKKPAPVVEQIEYAPGPPHSWRDNAILFRTNQQSRPLETALRTGGGGVIALIGGQLLRPPRSPRLSRLPENLLNPHDDISLLRIANTLRAGLSDVTMERLLAASHERKGSVFAAMQNPAVTTTFQPAKTRESIEAFVELIERTRAALTEHAASPLDPRPSTLSVWSDHFLDEIGYFNELRRGEKTPEAA